ncbi:hypothetical protein [cf. Phormidesmis sp. LEGE 11477]|uniref:hypothetical protein n=1 Tax=cf. Phormidesmis sp. LEGE 11477 TaxID=1828680 RepID=UPI00188204FC|nr:hypothetical protein [cf. Phormidesmis sp. LEGE 11477]MBE9063705.1 hypothetical protein [cf. Phormidesmis sp. LEGE 11477]
MSESLSDLTAQKSEEKKSRWKLPGVHLEGLQKASGQVSNQAVELAKNTAVGTHGLASKATEQALRSSIDQTMSAFQIAVEQIHERKIPAEKTALTGTINVGVIQLSIRVDIPMNEQTGEVEMEIE